MLKNLSAYGWISALIIAILCIIFMAITFDGPSYWSFAASLSNNDNDDDNEGTNDICWTTGFPWPSKKWSLSLNNGLCFPSIPSQNTLVGQTVSSEDDVFTFGDIFGSDAFKSVNDFQCIPWGGKTKGAILDTDMYSNNVTLNSLTNPKFGLMAAFCNVAESAVALSDDIDRSSLTCSNFESFSNKFQNGAKSAKAGVAFGVFAGVLSIAGLFFQGKESSAQMIQIIQGATGAFFLLILIMTILVIHFGTGGNNNPYTAIGNIEAYGCFQSYITGEVESLVAPGPSQVLTIITLIMSATMAGLCLTVAACFNPCCCPCCFTVDAPPSAIQTNIQVNGDNYGVKV